MIREMQPQDGAALDAIARRTPILGAQLAIEWALRQQNPLLPYRFYLVGSSAVLETTPTGAVVCGAVEEADELQLYVDFLNIDKLLTSGWVPHGWDTSPLCAMTKAGGGNTPSLPAGFDRSPSVTEVMQVLQSSAPLAPAAYRDNFYAALCTRLNHGYASLVGIRDSGTLVSTAGAYCIAPWEVCLSGVETAPAHRGKGYAATLVQWLGTQYHGRSVTLLCEAAMCPFYERLGFITADAVLITQTQKSPA